VGYEALLGVIQQQLGGQPPDVLGDAAYEVLAALNNDKTTSPDKRKKIEKLINPISEQMFSQLVSIGKLITDFHGADVPGDAAGDGTDMLLDDSVGVAVEFEEEEEDGSDKGTNFYQVCTCC
jgi:pre-mRNA-splicing helicase BRR2